MIRNESEYQEACERLAQERNRLTEHAARLRDQGHNRAELKRLLDPLRSFHLQLEEEVESYERLQRRELTEIENLLGLGRILIGARIALGLTQRGLAERLSVSESQVSRDERNEYHGITVERANRLLEALGVEVRCTFALPPFDTNGDGRPGPVVVR